MMITALKNALADYESYLSFNDQPDKNEVFVEITTFITDRNKFSAIAEILKTQFDSKFVPYDRQTKHNAFFIVPKTRKAEPKSFGDKPMLLIIAEGLEYEAKKLLEMAKDCRSQCK